MATSRNVLKDIPEVKTLDDIHALLAEQHLGEMRRLRRMRKSKIINSALGLIAVTIILGDGLFGLFDGYLVDAVKEAAPVIIVFAFFYFLNNLLTAWYDKKA